MRTDAPARGPGTWMDHIRPYLREGRRQRVEFHPEESVLLVIDMQRFFLESSSHAYLPDSEGILENIEGLLQAYRDLSLPIVFTRHALMPDESPGAMGRFWGDVLYDGDPMSEIVVRLRPRPEETVVRKTRYSAFWGTDLDRRLREMGVRQMVITGVMTHLCCETTARDAFVRDFDVFFVVDGTATRNRDLHLSSIKTMADGFVIPVEAGEVIEWLR